MMSLLNPDRYGLILLALFISMSFSGNLAESAVEEGLSDLSKSQQESISAETVRELVRTHYTRGRDYYRKGEFSKAKAEFQEVLKYKPEHQGARWYLKHAEKEEGTLLKREEKRKAREEKGANLKAGREEQLRLRREAEERERRRKEAELAAQRELKEKVAAHYSNARRYYRDGRYREAIEESKRVLKLDPQHRYAASLIERSQKRIQDAKEEVRLAAERTREEEVRSYYLKGRRLFRETSYQEAIEQFEKALALDPNHTRAANYLKRSRKRIEEAKAEELRAKEEAEASAREEAERKAREEQPRLRREAEARRREELASERAEKKIKVEKEPAKKEIIKALLAEGKRYYEEKEYQKAEQMFNRVLALDPENKEARSYLCYAIEREIEKRKRQEFLTKQREQERKAREERLAKLKADEDAERRRRQEELEKEFAPVTVNLDFSDVPLNRILATIAQTTDLNIIGGEELSQKISVHLKDVPLEDVFDIILKTTDYAHIRDGKILRIIPREEVPLVTEVFELQFTSAGRVKEVASHLLTEKGNMKSFPKFSEEKYSNFLVVTDTPESLEAIRELIKKLDKKLKQVMIEVKFCEVRLNEDIELGINWVVQASLSGASGETTFPLEKKGKRLIGRPASLTETAGSITMGTMSFADFTATLKALDVETEYNLIASPSIATRDGEEAEIVIGDKVPIPIYERHPETATLEVTGYQIEDIGVLLKVTPVINTDNTITLKVHPEVSEISGYTGPNNERPVISTREVTSLFTVEDGKTVVLGGLMREEIMNISRKVPVLGSIPLLGNIFRYRDESKERKELLIFITPRILHIY